MMPATAMSRVRRVRFVAGGCPVLVECLDEGEPRDRLAAAKALLQIGPRFRAPDVEFEHRLLDLEGRFTGDRPDPTDPDPIWNGQDDE